MKRKLIFILLLILFAGSLGAGFIGYFASKNNTSNKDNTPIDNSLLINYEYYLENVQVKKSSITNTSSNEVSTSEISTSEVSTGEIQNEKKYVFANYTCTNGITGKFDETRWEFIPDEIKEGTCKLYFNKAYYEVTLTISNGEIKPGVKTTVEREKDGAFGITPYEGYEYESSTCSNNKETSWDKDNNILKINAIMEDVTCKVVFKIKTVSMKVTVINGTGNATETIEYGKSVSTVVQPNTGFDTPTVVCTNDQKSTIVNNIVSVDKLTNNTECTITYAAQKVEEFSLTVDVPETIKFVSGSASQKISKGSDGEFKLKPYSSDIEIDDIVCTVVPLKTANADGSITYKFINMTKDISCKVVAKVVSSQ